MLKGVNWACLPMVFCGGINWLERPVVVGMVWICIKLERHIINSRLVMGKYI